MNRGARRALRALAGSVLLAVLFAAAGAAAGPAAWATSGPTPFDLRPVVVLESDADRAPDPPRTLYLPPGFSANVFARFEVPDARALAVAPGRALYVSLPRYGVVDVLGDRDGNGFADAHEAAVTGLACPYGLAVADGWLYVAQSQQVTRFPLSPDMAVPVAGPGEVVVTGLPAAPCAPHGYRPLAVSPADDALYVALGSSCNVCVEDGPGADLRARVWRYPLAQPGPGTEVARGLRNVTGLALNPWDGALWGVAAERDDLGDDLPPELITQIQPHADYGWPFCFRTPDGAWQPDARALPPDGLCVGLAAPTIAYQAHSSPLGLAFHDGRGLPAGFGPSLFVALHGSWDHRTGVGYKVVRVPLDSSGQPAAEPQEFALGWLPEPSPRAPDVAWGRPVSVAVGPEGALYVSDDKGGVIYRIAYTGA